jgi:hypothetical protein
VSDKDAKVVIKTFVDVLTVSTFGCFPGVWFILADVSEPSVRSIFKHFEDGPDRGFPNVGQYKPDAGETPKS